MNITGASTPDLTTSMPETENVVATLSDNFSILESVFGSCYPPHNDSTHVVVEAATVQRLSALDMDYVRNPVDGSVLLDHHGIPISVERLLSTKPLKQDLSTRPGPGNKKLTYMSGEVVTRTLNLIFGYDGWNLNIQNTQREECVQDEKGRWRVVYTALVRVTHLKSGAYREDCGMGDAIDRNMGIAISHAQKASITDAMKRAARHFGEKLGNSLYHGDFNISRAPASLQHALDQLDSERAKLLGTATNIKPNETTQKENHPQRTNAEQVNPSGAFASNLTFHSDQNSYTSVANSLRTVPCVPQQGPCVQTSVVPSLLSANGRPDAAAVTKAYNNQGGALLHQNRGSSAPRPAQTAPCVPQQSVQSSHSLMADTKSLAKAYIGQVGISGPNLSHPTLETNPGSQCDNTKPVPPLRITECSTVHNALPSSNAYPIRNAQPSFSSMPPTSTQGLQSSNLFGNNRDHVADLARPSTSVGRKSDPLPQPSEKSSLLTTIAPTCDSTHTRVPLSNVQSNGEESRKRPKLNPYA